MHQFQKEGSNVRQQALHQFRLHPEASGPQISSAVRRDPTTQSKEAKMPHNEQGANEHEATAPSRQIPDVTPPILHLYSVLVLPTSNTPFVSMQDGKMMFGQRPTCVTPRCEEGSECTSVENE